MVLEQRRKDYLQYLRFEKRYSPHTLTAYQKDLLQFEEFIVEQYATTDPGALSHFQVRSWLAALKDEGMGARTINRKISAINSFYRYQLRLGLVDKNPVAQLHAQKTPDRLPSYLREQETDLLLGELSFGVGFKGLTDRLICELLYQTGLRRNELVTLTEIQVEWNLGQIRVLGKGNKERLVPIGVELQQLIRDYLSEKSKLEQADVQRLLVLESGLPLYAGYVYRVVTHYLGAVTTQKKRSPHVLRHSFATHLLGNGAGIQAIKELLGHSSLAATQVYAHTNIEQLKNIHKLNHPRG